MTRADFCRKLDSIMELPPGTIKGDERLEALESWDSLSLMAFIAMVDSEFDQRVAGEELARCKTVPDLIALVGDRVAA